jgi:hypothetical protein
VLFSGTVDRASVPAKENSTMPKPKSRRASIAKTKPAQSSSDHEIVEDFEDVWDGYLPTIRRLLHFLRANGRQPDAERLEREFSAGNHFRVLTALSGIYNGPRDDIERSRRQEFKDLLDKAIRVTKKEGHRFHSKANDEERAQATWAAGIQNPKVIAEVERIASTCAPNGAEDSTRPSLDDEDEAILRALNKAWPRRQTQDQIAGQSRLSRKTVGKRMPKLFEVGLVEYPGGPKQGATITTKGKELLDQLKNPQAR